MPEEMIKLDKISDQPWESVAITPETHADIRNLVAGQSVDGKPMSREALANALLYLARTNPGLVAQAKDIVRRHKFSSCQDMVRKGW